MSEEKIKLTDKQIVEKLKEISKLESPLIIEKELKSLSKESNYNLKVLIKQLNYIQKSIGKSGVTNDTNDTFVTNDTVVTNEEIKACVSFVTCNKPFLHLFSGDSTFDKIRLNLLLSNRALTFGELAIKTGKSEANIRNTIFRNKQYFGSIKPNGKICYTYLLQMNLSEFQRKINNFLALERQNKEREENKNMEQNRNEKVITLFKSFMNLYNKEILNNEFYLNFLDLAEFNIFLSEELEKNPTEILKLFELSIKEFFGLNKNVNVLVYNLPKDKNISIEQLRTTHLNNLLAISGRVVTLSDIRPQVVNAKFECPSCGTVISVLQIEKKFREPSRCSCGRKGGFRLISKEMVDTARLILEDLQEKTDNPHSKRLNCYLKDYLLSHEKNKLYEPGNEIKVIGVLKEVPIPLNAGGVSTRFELAFEVNSVYQTEEEITSENLSDDEVEDILKLANKIDESGLDVLVESFAPEIYGHEIIKKAICLQLASKPNEVGKKEKRNKPNILLIGDPGTSKSKLGEYSVSITPGARRSVGGSASAVGLTGAVVRDDYTGGWRLEPGAAVLARDFYMLDELNNVRDEDKPRLQELLSEHTITFDKATIHAKLKAISGVLATANPIHGLFNEEEELVRQFNLSHPIINRFDLIFIVRDKVNEKEDKLIAKRMNQREMENLNPEYDSDFLKKFFVYIKEQPNPLISEEVSEKLSDVYSKLRKYKTKSSNINPRVNVALLQLCKASAKIRLSETVEEKDIERALKILSKSYFNTPEYEDLKTDIFM
jgi:DNA replicative helicase MCM subunit Mcm2 (Cdc46/Mcm family)